MVTIEYANNGVPVPDWEARAEARRLFSPPNVTDYAYYVYSTENMIYAIRALVAKGEIDYTNVQFKFKDSILPVEKDGRLKYWPVGFSDFFDECLTDLMV